MAHEICALSSFKEKYICPLEWWLKLEISPSTQISLKVDSRRYLISLVRSVTVRCSSSTKKSSKLSCVIGAKIKLMKIKGRSIQTIFVTPHPTLKNRKILWIKTGVGRDSKVWTNLSYFAFFLCRFFLSLFFLLCVAILCRFLFLPLGKLFHLQSIQTFGCYLLISSSQSML